MAARIYNPDHTADIRSRLKQMALLGLVGLFRSSGSSGGRTRRPRRQWTVVELIRLASIAVVCLVSISLVSLALTPLMGVHYLRRRTAPRIASLRSDPEHLAASIRSPPVISGSAQQKNSEPGIAFAARTIPRVCSTQQASRLGCWVDPASAVG